MDKYVFAGVGLLPCIHTRHEFMQSLRTRAPLPPNVLFFVDLFYGLISERTGGL